MCLKLLSKLLTKKDDMPKPNDFVYSSDYRQPYIYEVIDMSITAPASGSTGPVYSYLNIPHKYSHRPLILGYASTDPNFSDKHRLGDAVWREETTSISSVFTKSYTVDASSFKDKIQVRATTSSTNMSSKVIYFRLFLISRANDSIPGKRQIIPKGNFNLNTDLSNLQIYKEGSLTIPAGQTSVKINHDLGYAPLVLCWWESDYYSSDPTNFMTSEAERIARSTKDYVQFSFDYASPDNEIYYYMILTERIPDGQSS